jgi:hypothetical protein
MNAWQSNGYRDISVAQTPNGIRLDSGIDYHDGTFKAEASVALTEVDCQTLITAFALGSPATHSQSWELSEGRKLVIYGKGCGNMGDWLICQGRQWLIQGSGNFSGLIKALQELDGLSA